MNDSEILNKVIDAVEWEAELCDTGHSKGFEVDELRKMSSWIRAQRDMETAVSTTMRKDLEDRSASAKELIRAVVREELARCGMYPR
jgi:hypothetical protein